MVLSRRGGRLAPIESVTNVEELKFLREKRVTLIPLVHGNSYSFRCPKFFPNIVYLAVLRIITNTIIPRHYFQIFF